MPDHIRIQYCKNQLKRIIKSKCLTQMIILKITYRPSSDDHWIATLSEFYPTVAGIIKKSGSSKPELRIRAIWFKKLTDRT